MPAAVPHRDLLIPVLEMPVRALLRFAMSSELWTEVLIIGQDDSGDYVAVLPSRKSILVDVSKDGNKE